MFYEHAMLTKYPILPLVLTLLMWLLPLVAATLVYYLVSIRSTMTPLYMGLMIDKLEMTRKVDMKEGIVARTFHISEDIDQRLKIRAAKDKLRFSQVVETALKKYLDEVDRRDKR